MSDYIRARNAQQKLERMNEIMNVTDVLFSKSPYQDITLTTIAQALNSSRSNLYKYVTTKEEIFLELFSQKQEHFYNDLKNNFYSIPFTSTKQFALLITDIISNNTDFLRYQSILLTIIETNVTVERLAEFKKKVVNILQLTIELIGKYTNLNVEKSEMLYWAIIHYACGINNSCCKNPLIKQAMKLAQIPEKEIDFKDDLKQYINIYCKGLSLSD